MKNTIIDKDYDYELSVLSSNSTERILARRIRIQRRLEDLVKQKEQRDDVDCNESGSVIKKTPLDAQIEKSFDLLEGLITEGEEYVTNVCVAAEARETDRREHEGFRKEKLFQKLDDEAAQAQLMFNEIANKWSVILKYNDPLHINEDINNQKEKCDELVKQKDEIIANLKAKLRSAEIFFSNDQKKQIEDINTIAYRIENQIFVMRKAYREELEMIEEVILAQRRLQIEANNKKWEELYKRRDQKEKNNGEQQSEVYWSFVENLSNLNRDFQELYRSTTIKIENDCDELQREFERIKSDAIMNSEKLDYNYQILKKREDENLIIRSQQKRKINKLQDCVIFLQTRNNNYYKTTMDKITKLSVDIKKVNQNILDIENKADHVAKVNNLKFKQVWIMNKQRAKNLLKKIFDVDKVLYEQQLGIEWEPIKYKLPFLDLEIDKVNDNKEKRQILNDEQNQNNLQYQNIIKQILQLMADKTGYLIEDNLNSILRPYLKEERKLIEIDNIFLALKIKEKNHIDLLFQFFLPYMFCPICNINNFEKVTSEDENFLQNLEMVPLEIASSSSNNVLAEDNNMEMPAEVESNEKRGSVVECGPLSVTIYDSFVQGECRGPDKVKIITEKSVQCSDLNMKNKIPCEYQHPLLIGSVYVLRALQEFLENYHVPEARLPTMETRLSHKRATFSRDLASEAIEKFWQEFTSIFAGEKIQLWDSLLEGLKKYHELLRARKNISEEVDGLRQQNAQLRQVFSNYIEKKDIL